MGHESDVLLVVQGPKTIGASTTLRSTNWLSKYLPRKTIIGLGVAQIVLGSLNMLTEVIVITAGGRSLGNGIWSGTLFGMCGLFSIMSITRTSLCSVVASLAISILTAILAIGALSPAFWLANCKADRCSVLLVVGYSFEVVICLAQLALCISVGAFTCRTTCGRSRLTMASKTVFDLPKATIMDHSTGTEESCVVVIPIPSSSTGSSPSPTCATEESKDKQLHI